MFQAISGAVFLAAFVLLSASSIYAADQLEDGEKRQNILGMNFSAWTLFIIAGVAYGMVFFRRAKSTVPTVFTATTLQ